MKNADSPAFPLDAESYKRVDEGYFYNFGLTKREYFAALAMQGLLANMKDKKTTTAVAESAVLIADELLKQLNP